MSIVTNTRYYWEGREAYTRGHNLDMNPYIYGTMAYQQWNIGGMRAQAIMEGEFS